MLVPRRAYRYTVYSIHIKLAMLFSVDHSAISLKSGGREFTMDHGEAKRWRSGKLKVMVEGMGNLNLFTSSFVGKMLQG